MAPKRQVAHRQLELLVEFVESNKEIVLGNFAKQNAHKAWEELACRLNSIGGGLIKTPANWKGYWHLLICRTKGKAADIRRSHGGTGGGPNKIIPLSDLEERIIAIIGKVAVEGIPEVQIPINFDLTAEAQPSGSPSATHESPSETQPSGSSSFTAPASSFEMGLQQNINLDMEFPVTECQKVELEISLTEQPRDEPADLAAEPASSAAPEPVAETVAAAGGSRASRRSCRPRRAGPRPDSHLPGWAYELEQRRVASEGRIAAELAALGATSRAISESLQQLVGLLQAHLTKK